MSEDRSLPRISKYARDLIENLEFAIEEVATQSSESAIDNREDAREVLYAYIYELEEGRNNA